MNDKPAPTTDDSWTDPSVEPDLDGDEAVLDASREPALETPVEDAVEQAQEAVRAHSEAVRKLQLPPDVDPADLAEQSREVPHDEDEYR